MAAKLTTRPCSIDGSFEYIDFDALSEESPSNGVEWMLNTTAEPRCSPVTEEQFSQFLDHEGRLVAEHSLRKAVYLGSLMNIHEGGVDPSVRRDVWGFLFGLYPCSSTAREREVLLLDYFVKYEELKSRWKKMLVADSNPTATPVEQGLIAKYQIETGDDQSDGSSSNLDFLRTPDIHIPTSPNHQCTFNHDYHDLPFDIHNPEIRQQIDFLKIQAKVYVTRHEIDLKNLRHYLRIIDKDVPRTDRDYDFFKGARNPHLSQLRDMLITFSAFHPHVGYAQGMNDIIARFLVVYNTEVFEAFWCFKSYMDCVHNDFTEDGMMEKIKSVQTLLEELDPDLFHYFHANDLGDLLFCHRWLLLGFKREFSFLDSLRCFEILSCHHLELSSLEAERAKRLGEMQEFENENGVHRLADQEYKKEYTFELFMCIALLIENRDELMTCSDASMVFKIINSLSIDLDGILRTSEKLFFQYCKKAVRDCFLIVDGPSPIGGVR